MKPNVLRIQLDRRLFGERSRKRTVVLAVPGRLIGHSQRPNGPELRDLPPCLRPLHASLPHHPLALLIEQTLESP